VLTVTAERHFPRQEGDEITVSERPQGRFNRQLFLGESLDADQIAANYDQGVLTLHIPVAERAKPRKVEISAGAPEMVEVTASTSSAA
jgi:HSP20 family protein